MSYDDWEVLQRAGESTDDDWLGTSAADTDMTINAVDLYELAKIDRKRWMIVGMDFFGYGRPRGDVYLYAVDREREGIDSHAAMPEHVGREGSIPVTSILLHEVTAQQIMEKSFKSVHMQLRHIGWEDKQMHIVDRTDVPEQT